MVAKRPLERWTTEFNLTRKKCVDIRWCEFNHLTNEFWYLQPPRTLPSSLGEASWLKHSPSSKKCFSVVGESISFPLSYSHCRKARIVFKLTLKSLRVLTVPNSYHSSQHITRTQCLFIELINKSIDHLINK